jgi:hypothetical protein
MSAMPWVKLHTDTVNSHKLARLAREHRWTYVCLEVLAGQCDAEGYLVDDDGPLSLDDLCHHLRETPDYLQPALAAITSTGLVVTTERGWLVVGFAERQGRSQSEKRAQWRESKARSRAESRDPEWTLDAESAGSPNGVQEDSNETPTPREEKIREEDRTKSANAPSTMLADLSPAAQHYFSTFNRKRWNNDQREAFVQAEAEVGAEIMLRAVRWAGVNNISRISSICSTARKMARDKGNRVAGPPPWAGAPATGVWRRAGTE